LFSCCKTVENLFLLLQPNGIKQKYFYILIKQFKTENFSQKNTSTTNKQLERVPIGELQHAEHIGEGFIGDHFTRAVLHKGLARRLVKVDHVHRVT